MNITVASIKGGVGKTTIGFFLACEFAHTSRTVFLDTDKQQSGMEIWEDRQSREGVVPFSAFANTTKRLRETLAGIEYDVCVVDTGGRDNPAFRASWVISDYVIMPLSPTTLDLRSTERTFELASEVKEIKPEQQLAVVINQAPTTSRKDTEELVTLLREEFSKDYDFKLFESILSQRVIYPRSVARGMTPAEYLKAEKKSNQKALNEYSNFIKEAKTWAT